MDKEMLVQLKCPFCKRRILDASKSIKSSIQPASQYSRSDYYAKCWNCGRIIGISKIG